MEYKATQFFFCDYSHRKKTNRLLSHRFILKSATSNRERKEIHKPVKSNNTNHMKKALILFTVLAGMASLNSCCSSTPAPAPEPAPTYVAPVK
jgi:hypothetical protein